ncbi:MAG TPA: hypothetical protein VI861_02400, partial [Rickettsiales bacterium]|nr:hypothetical protein [Rickettsiales bacterium]
IPLIFIVAITSYATFEKIFSHDLKIGFFALINHLQDKINSGQIVNLELTNQIIFNQKLVASLSIFFITILWITLIDGAYKTYKNLCSKK